RRIEIYPYLYPSIPGLSARAVGESLEAVLFVPSKILYPVLREMPKSRHTWVIGSPSKRRAEKSSPLSMTAPSFHGNHTPREESEMCNPCVRYGKSPTSRVAHPTRFLHANQPPVTCARTAVEWRFGGNREILLPTCEASNVDGLVCPDPHALQ